MPELIGRHGFYDVIISGLEQRGLLNSGIHGIVTATGMVARRTTPLGHDFISFISTH